ncbi:MAG TPA: NAD(P)/FAD-dependent oxidoreductase [Tepidisphaeraceae bacterium]|jgi:flavin-dependent dehydrogenase
MDRRILIIGGGPAGSTAAFLLARGGCEVTLAEQHRFPRDKVCGECLSATGMEVLTRIGLAGELRTFAPIRFTHTAIHPAQGPTVRLPLPRPMWGISRARFDQFLLDAARLAGTRILQPARCEGIDPGLPPAVRLRMLESNELTTVQSDCVLLADGKSALLREPADRTSDFGIKAHFENVDGPRDTIELFGCDGLYGGLAAVEDGRWNAAFSVPASRLRMHRGNVAELFVEIVGENAVLGGRLAAARRVGPWLASPLPRFPVRANWPPGVIPIGNGAAALEPIGGEGMGLALRSAELAAQAILRAEDMADVHRLAHDYRRLWRVRRPAWRAAACVASRAELAGSLVPLLGQVPAVARHALRRLGK